MAFGPFENYAPPGTYTRTVVEQDSSGPPVGVRIPVFVGVGKETLSQTDFELVRGSSGSVDQRIVNEDVDARFVLDDSNPQNLILGDKDGETAKFQVRNFPVVRGDGTGTTTNNPQDVTVTVDGDLVAPAALDGERGVVTLQVPPTADAEVRVTYFFNREDTLITDDVSEQVSDDAAVLLGTEAAPYDVVAGTNDVLLLTVDGVSASITLSAGTGRTANNIANDINAAGVTGLTASVDEDNQGALRLQLSAQGSLVVGGGSANTLLGFFNGQSTTRNRVFFTYQAPIVTGENGGITTTNPADVDVFVDGQQVVPEEVDGTLGAVTLEQAPPVGATVTIRYHFNSWQDTFDYLPNTGIRSVTRVGISPGRTDFIEGNDYIIDSNGRILWGAAITIESGSHTAGTEFFDDTQITASLVDNKIWLEQVDRFVDRSLSPPQTSDTVVVLGNVPTLGNGRNTPLDAETFSSVSNERQDVPTHRVDLVKIYHGSNISEALANGAVTVTDVNPSTRRVAVEEPIPPDHMVWATYYYNRLEDDTATFTVLSQSTPTTPGQYEILSERTGESLLGVRFGTTSATDTIQWPSGVESNPDALITGTDGVEETVTVTFKKVDATPAIYTNDEASPYDLYASESDTLHLDVGGNTLAVDLNTAGFGVIVSDGFEDGWTFTITTGENDDFEFEVDGVEYSVTLQPGDTGADIADRISRAVDTLARIDGTNQDAANGGADFTLTGTTTYSIELNGTTYTQADAALTAGTYDAAAVAAEIESTLVTASGLTAGDVTVPGNDFEVVANADGTVSILASDSVTVNDTVNAGDELEDIIGFAPLGSQQVNIDVAVYRDSGTDNEHFLLRSQVTPTGPGDLSRIRVLDGNANATLGFDDFQSADGAENAVNKAATLLSDSISSADRTNLGNATDATFVVTVNGTNFQVDLTGLGATPAVSAIATAIDTAITSQGSAVVEDTDKIRITSNVATNNSRIEVGAGTANQYIGFEEGDEAVQRRSSVEEIVSVLNSQVASDWYSPVPATDFIASAFAEVFELTGDGDFLKLQTFAVGTTASVTLLSGADNALNDTGIGMEIGDTASGSDEIDAFDVASDLGSNGSAGEGIVGQTYTDDATGLRFTILAAEDGAYTAGDSFTLVVSETFETGSSRVVKAVPGTEITVINTSDVGVGDTALVNTFAKTGSEPGTGDFYYITYEYEKSDFSPRLFTRFRDIQQNYGTLAPENPLTLASFLAILNGAVIVGAKQVLKQPGQGQASVQSYLEALDELRRPLPGGTRPDMLVPLTTDPDVFGAYVQHAEIQSSIRFRNERRCIFGVASGTRPEDASAIAEGLNSERAMLLYPDSAIITLANEEGVEESFIVNGTYLAAALAGSLANPQFDVATPVTRRRLTGFRRLNRALDEVEMNQLAVSGVTVLQDRGTSLQVRDGLTTNVSSRFTSTPSIVAIKDFVQQQARATLDRFIGLKFLTSRAQDVEIALTGLLNGLVENQIIVDFQGVTAEPDPDDPTTLRVRAFYAPVFPLKYIVITFTIGTSNSL